MKLTLFARTILGYLLFVVLVSVVSIYAISQLNEVKKVSRSIILHDNILMGFYEKLTDQLFSETRSEKKYIIMQDDAFNQSFKQVRQEFDEQLFNAILHVESADVKRSLYRVNRNHYLLYTLFSEEVNYLRTGREYDRDWYDNEKEKAADTILKELKKLRGASEKNVILKIIKLNEMGARASRVALVITAVSLICGLILSIVATRSITMPLALMKKKTIQISKGELAGDLRISSPPEIAQLAESFNMMSGRLKEVETMKSDFFSLMSHELRTPLTSIKEGTNLLLEGLAGEISDNQKRLLAIIAEESNRLIKLVNALLDLTKMEAGMMGYHFAETDLNSLLEQVETEIMPLAESKKITFVKTISKVAPVKIDKERILQALRNLIGNAVKFSPEEGQVFLALHPVGDGVEVAISDTGPGIPEADSRRIFGKFQQSATGTATKAKGTGLGLAIVEHIISAHGGKIWVESKPGQGATFYFVLPVC